VILDVFFKLVRNGGKPIYFIVFVLREELKDEYYLGLKKYFHLYN